MRDQGSPRSCDLLLAIGDVVGRVSIVSESPLISLHDRYRPFTIPFAPWVRSDFTLALRVTQPCADPASVLSDLDRQPVQVSFGEEAFEVRRHDMSVRFTRTGPSWVGEGFCHGSELAIEVLLRALWSVFLSLAGGGLVHACAVRSGAAAVLLPGVSGAGKSTLSAKWERREDVLSDELVPVRRGADGVWRVYASPFWGGLRSGGRSLAGWPLLRIAFLAKASSPAAIPLSTAAAATRLMETAVNFDACAGGVARTLEFVAGVCNEIPSVELHSGEDTPAAAIRQVLAMERSEEIPEWPARAAISEVRTLLHMERRYALRVNGTSMAPSVRSGDIIFLEPVVSDKMEPGEMVVFWRPGVEAAEDVMVCHRVMWGRPRGRMVTKGDQAASWESFFDGREAELLARVSGIARRETFRPTRSRFGNWMEAASSIGRMVIAGSRGIGHEILSDHSS
jgi:hypothetical protein